MSNFLVVADPLEYVEEEDGEASGQKLFPQPAFAKAIELAAKGDTVEVLIVIYESLLDLDISEADDSDGLGINFQGSVRDLLVENEERKWQRYLEQFWPDTDLDFNLLVHVAWGKNLFEIIVERVEELQCELIIKSGHRTETLFHTPTDWLLFRDAPVPVLSVCVDTKHKPKGKEKTVIITALDLLSQNPDKRWLNQQLVVHASDLARLMGADLHFCVAIDIPGLVKDLELIDVNGHLKTQEELIQKEAKVLFNTLNLPLKKDNLHIREGSPHGVINYYSRLLNVSCIVVGSMGNRGVKGKLIGNTAERVVHLANRDLMVV